MKNDYIKFCRIMNDDEYPISELGCRIFREEIAPFCSHDGIRYFTDYIQPYSIKSRLESNYFIDIAVLFDTLLGFVEVRDFCHIAMLFVDKAFRGRKISKELVRTAVKSCLAENKSLKIVTANSVPHSVVVYEKLGFKKTGQEQEKNGICFFPMALVVSGAEILKKQ